MLRPFLLIGIGGSGGKTLRIVRHELERRLAEHGWEGGFPAGWRFLHIDVPSIADGDDPDLPAQLPGRSTPDSSPPALVTETSTWLLLARAEPKWATGSLRGGQTPAR